MSKLIYVLIAVLVVAVPVTVYVVQRQGAAPAPEPHQMVSSGSDTAAQSHEKPNHGEFRDRFQPKPPSK
jgi:hypothetical protein